MKIKVAAIQMSAEIANHAANVERAKNLIRQAAEDGCSSACSLSWLWMSFCAMEGYQVFFLC